jgi:long-chain acyl-CoA synthetase
MNTIPQIIDETKERMLDKIALQIKRKRGEAYEEISYRDLKTMVDMISEGLRSLGMEKGDCVGLISENRPEWAMAYLGILKGGGVVVPLDPQLKPGELQAILEIAKVKFCFCSSLYMIGVIEVKKSLPFFQRIISLEEEVPVGVHSLTMDEVDILSFSQLTSSEIEAPSGSEERSPDVKETDLAVLIFTSGTTGKSKGVMLSHRNIVSNVHGLQEAVYFDEKDTFISLLPLHHAFEATCGFLVPLSEGAAITYARSLKSRDILEGISETGVTVMLGVPLIFEKMLEGIFRAVKVKSPLTRGLFKTFWGVTKGMKGLLGLNVGRGVFKSIREKAGLSTLRLMVCGGAPLAPEIGKGFETLGIKFVQGYGLSESSPVLTLNPPEKVKMKSIGKPVPGVEVKISEPDDKGIGEIVARGPNIMEGYYEDPVRTRETIRDGWLYTGDIGWQDSNGYVYVAGRSKNVIVTKAGKNVYPEEIEEELHKSPYIAEVMVFGKINPETDREEVCAMVYPNYEEFGSSGTGPESDPSREMPETPDRSQDEVVRVIGQEIKRHCDRLADFKRVKDFEIRKEEFPKTTTKKIKRFMIK